jgi:hypothetical protein
MELLMPSPQELQYELDRHRGEHDAEKHINFHGEITFLATDKRTKRMQTAGTISQRNIRT